MREWMYVAYATYLGTYLTGLTFFIRFDLKHRPLRRRLLGLHVTMAVMSFIALTGAMALYAFPPSHATVQKPSQSTLWYYIEQHRSELRNRHHQPTRP